MDDNDIDDAQSEAASTDYDLLDTNEPNNKSETEITDSIECTNGSGGSLLPIQCEMCHDPPGMFRVTRARGKALLSGGYGVTIVTTLAKKKKKKKNTATAAARQDSERENNNDDNDDNDNDNDNDENDEEKETNSPTSPNQEINAEKTSQEYLFLEEVLCLYEQGMLECHDNESTEISIPSTVKKDNKSNENDTMHATLNDNEMAANGDSDNDNNSRRSTLSSPMLYALLEPCGLSMASYLVYAHLRQQTFRVLRYTPQRLSILRQLQASPPNSHDRREWHLQLRRDVQQAPPPAIIYQQHFFPSSSSSYSPGINGDNAKGAPSSSSSSSSSWTSVPTFAFCVYNPDSSFSKTNPGLPAFLVAVTPFGQSALTFDALQCLSTQAQGVPIKIATVSDSGTVVMFGISSYGVPNL